MAEESLIRRRYRPKRMTPKRDQDVGQGLRVAIVDSSADVRGALERRLGEDPRVAAACAFGHDADERDALWAFDPQIVLVDPRTPDGATDDAGLPAVMQGAPAVGRYVIIAHVTYHRAAEELALREAGADVYCLKGMPIAALVGLCVDTIRRGLPVERWPAVAHAGPARTPVVGM